MNFQRSLPLLLAAAVAGASPLAALAEGGTKIPVRDALQLATALRNLDGHLVQAKQNGVDGTMMVPWDFGSGSLRLRIANDLSIVMAVETSIEKTRQQIVRELLKKIGGTELRPGTPEFEEFQRQYNDALDQPAAGTQDLARIKADELKLDRNEIPVTVISALKPILDQ